jgi:hypothetical protein
MSPPSLQPAKRSATTFWRVRFIEGAAPIVESIPEKDLASTTDHLEVMTTTDAREQSAKFLATDNENSPLPVSIKLPAGRIAWRPGRAILEGDSAWCEEALPVLAEFASCESRLRQLEFALPAFEQQAPRDVALAYRPADQHQNEWDRLGKTMEQLANLRLGYARLEPKLLYRSLTHKPDECRLFSRLCRAADTEDRLEAVTNRLEACEDLYEGAIDRINDHRWYRKGHRLELAIVVLLVIEVLQIAAELALHFRGK